MPVVTTAELVAMLKEVGVAVTYGAASTYGRFRTMDDVAVGEDGFAEVVGAAETVTVATGTLGTLAIDDAIEVDGVDYTIRDHRRIGDGTLTRVWLRSA